MLWDGTATKRVRREGLWRGTQMALRQAGRHPWATGVEATLARHPPPPPRRLPSGRVGEGPAGAPRPSRQLPGCEKKEGEAEEKEGGGAFASHPGSSPPPRLFPRTFLTSALPLPCVMGPSRSPEPLLPVRTHHHHRQKGMAEERPRTRSASLLASIAPLLAPAPSPVPLRGEGEGEASFSLSLGARALHLLLVFA